MAIIVATIVAIFAATALHGQAPTQPAPALPPHQRLLGVFNFQTGEPIDGAQVTDVLSGTSALTTKTGTVSLSFLPEGGSLVRIQKVGFAPTTIMASMSQADTVPFTILLKPVVQTLPTVVTTDSAPKYLSPGLRAFEERRRMGIGTFITDAELRKNDSRSMTTLVRELGINVKCTTRTPIRCYALSNRQGGCEFDVYLNGHRVVGVDRDLETMFVNLTGGVEVYAGPATIPAEYNMTGSACGVILFWARES